MFAIAYWHIDSTFTVMNLQSIKTPRRELNEYQVGDEVSAFYKKQLLDCRIFEIGEDRTFLSKKLDKGSKLDLEVLLENDGHGKEVAKLSPLNKVNRATEQENIGIADVNESKKRKTVSQTSKISKKSCLSEYPEDQEYSMAILKARRDSHQAVKEFPPHEVPISTTFQTPGQPMPETYYANPLTSTHHFQYTSQPHMQQQQQICIQQSIEDQWSSQQHQHQISPQYQEQPDFGNILREAMDTLNQPSNDLPQSSHDQAIPSENSCHGCCKTIEFLIKEVKELKQQMKEMQAAQKKISISTISLLKDPAPLTTDFINQTTPATGDMEDDHNLKGKIIAAISKEKKIPAAVKKAMRAVFTIEELTTCSMRGLHTNKSCEKPRQGLPVAKRDTVQEVIAESFDISLEESFTKMRTALRSFRSQWSGLKIKE